MSQCIQALRRAAAAAQGNRCYYCNLPIWQENCAGFAAAFGLTEAQAELLRCTAEHLLPKCEGGRNIAANVVAACRFCNNKRHARAKSLAPAPYRRLVQQRLARGQWLVPLLGAKMPEAISRTHRAAGEA